MHDVLVLLGLICVPLLAAAPVGLPALWALGTDRNTLGYLLLIPAALTWAGVLAIVGVAWT